MEIHAKNALDAWRKSLIYIQEQGKDFKDRDNRNCREVLNLVVKIENPEKDGDKPIDMIRQFEWIYPNKEELSAIILNKEESAGYEFSYGPRIFNYSSIKNQINDFVIPLLKKDMNSRRAVVSLFNPLTDSNILSKNIPSIMFIYFKIIGDALDLTFFIRSNDFFIGWPGNIYQIMTLQKYVATQLNMKIGTLTTISCSAHIFHEHFDMINKIIR
jgi:thymidylate synthase